LDWDDLLWDFDSYRRLGIGHRNLGRIENNV
jgi:hypothetical protein